MQTQVELENESVAMVANLEYSIDEALVLESAFENSGTAAVESKVSALSQFRNHFVGYMDLYADAATAIAYLDAHQGWFCRCAHPLKVKPIGSNAYALGIGHVGALGYKVDPRIGLDLLPQKEGIYRIQSIPLADQEPQVYEVDFQAVMILKEQPADAESGAVMTSVEWQLDLTVTMPLPRFVQVVPQNVLQKTGDSVLAHVVKSISQSLTAKVQADFHKTVGVTVPKNAKKRK
jgi:uncharacterized protein YqgV (UPF0045/DUF77 family)